MSLASDINTTSTSLSDIKNAIIAKGVTPTGNITTYAAAINSIDTVNNTTLSVTPSTTAQSFEPASPYTGYGQVSIAAVTAVIDANIVAGNIKSGVSILGVTGSLVGLNGETVNITPSTSQQIITPTAPANGITQATVAAVDSSIDTNITAGNIKNGVSILGVTGTYEGTTPTLVTKTITENGTYNASSDNADGYSSVTVSVSGGGGGKKYNVLDRVSDDSNNEIGTVVGFHIDANNVEYAVVCLDGVYRLGGGQYLSSEVRVTGIPMYENASVYGAPETATTNCDAILATAQAQGLTSSAVSHCRAQTFTIDGVSYAGQLPTLMELVKIFEHRTRLNAADPTKSEPGYITIGTGGNYWSSTQRNASFGWGLRSQGDATYYPNTKYENYTVLPVLEIPNA